MKHMSMGPTRSLRLRAVVAYPAVSVAAVVVVALALTPFGTSSVMALTTPATPTETSAPTAAPATTAPATAVPTSAPAPAASVPTSAPAPATAAPLPALAAVPSPVPGPTPSLSPAAGDHHVVAWIQDPQLPASYLPVDAPALNASPFETFRVRFQVQNTGTFPLTAVPQLEYSVGGSGSYTVVPEKPLVGIPVAVTREWVPSDGLGGGTMQGPLGEDIMVANLRLGAGSGLAMTGHHSMGANPDQAVTLPSSSYTEEEFTVSLTIDAQYLTSYDLRITGADGKPLSADVATITLGPAPALRLSPGQRQGTSQAAPKATNAAGAAFPLQPASLTVTTTTATSTNAVTALYRANAVSYPLALSTLSAATTTPSDIHGPYSMSTSACAVCHRIHAAQAPTLLIKGSQSTVCFMCHNGMGASTDVQAQYVDPSIPANDPGASAYYSHDALVPATNTESALNEFGGVTNRSSQCSDCHNAHQAATADGIQTTTGWTAPGQLSGVSGVSVVNGAAGSAPTYNFLDGVTNPVTLEYQLCLKCHSSFTNLLPQVPGKPSTDALDAGAEFNPANASFHPVEAPGTNQTAKMADSLAGTSPYKLWTFTPASTIRCLNCHASGITPIAAPAPAAGGDLSAHTSPNRGILVQSYQDRVLSSATAAYTPANFALCYTCHAEEPFANSTADDTNFPLHGLHTTGLAGIGTGGTDIDTADAGQGNALCAECHFRLHSTTFKVGTQAVPGSRLVNFAPDVTPYPADGGTISWTPNANGGGSCTLTCHGKSHDNLSYN